MLTQNRPWFIFYECCLFWPPAFRCMYSSSSKVSSAHSSVLFTESSFLQRAVHCFLLRAAVSHAINPSVPDERGQLRAIMSTNMILTTSKMKTIMIMTILIILVASSPEEQLHPPHESWAMTYHC